MELETIHNYVQNASVDELKALGFLGQWMMEIKPKYCICTSQCDQKCELVRNLGEAFQMAGRRLQSL